ncbi:MAG TPA: hypothetical protein VHW26_08545, partial [Solirubrobacteraceae bacterium]|nr:hypothetical protein [Solirubrobacteraceae bacterium]
MTRALRTFPIVLLVALLVAATTAGTTAASSGPATAASTGGTSPATRPAAGSAPAASSQASVLPGVSSSQLTKLRATLAAAMRRAGSSSGALVVDISTGQPIYSLRPNAPRTPASVEKLYT